MKMFFPALSVVDNRHRYAQQFSILVKIHKTE